MSVLDVQIALSCTKERAISSYNPLKGFYSVAGELDGHRPAVGVSAHHHQHRAKCDVGAICYGNTKANLCEKDNFNNLRNKSFNSRSY